MTNAFARRAASMSGPATDIAPYGSATGNPPSA